MTTTFDYDRTGNLTSKSTPLTGASPAQTQTTTYTYGDAAHPGDVTDLTDPRTSGTLLTTGTGCAAR